MFENDFIKVGDVIVRLNLVKSVYDDMRDFQKQCVIRYTDNTESKHRWICADDFWKALEKIS